MENKGKCIGKVEKARNRNLMRTMERIWVESESKLNILNYFWYRYFTNQFILYCLRTKYTEEGK